MTGQLVEDEVDNGRVSGEMRPEVLPTGRGLIVVNKTLVGNWTLVVLTQVGLTQRTCVSLGTATNSEITNVANSTSKQGRELMMVEMQDLNYKYIVIVPWN